MNTPKLSAVLFFPRRIVWLILTFLVMMIVIFAFWRVAASNPAQMFGPRVSPEQVEIPGQPLGLDQPIWKQYILYLGRMVRGDLGSSMLTKRPVIQEMREWLPSTLRFLGLSIPIGIILSLLTILMGVLALWVRAKVPILGAILQRLGQTGVAVGIATPVFLLGPFLLYLFALKLEWFPTGGWTDLGSERSFDLSHAVLPVLTLAILPACLVARSMLGEIAHFWNNPPGSRGPLLTHAVLSFFRHGLIQTIGMLGGALLVESVFMLPGIGRLFVQAIYMRDFFMMHGLVYLFLILALILRALADLVQGIDAFVLLKLKAVEPEAAVRTPVERPPYAKALGWVWIAFCLLLVIVPFARGMGGYLTGGDGILKSDLVDRLLPPGSESADGFTYAWGTDALGRDVRGRALYALGLDLGSSLLVTLAVLLPALLGGLLTGYLAEKSRSVWVDLLDDLLMFPVDVLTSLPGLILLAFILAVMGPGLRNLLVWLAPVFLLPRCIRMVRNWWIAASPEKNVWLRLVGVVLGILVLGIGLAVVTQPVLGFLGLGIQPPTPGLGSMLAEGLQYMHMQTAFYIVLRPGWTLLSAALGWFLLADTLLSKFGIRKRDAWLELNR